MSKVGRHIGAHRLCVLFDTRNHAASMTSPAALHVHSLQSNSGMSSKSRGGGTTCGIITGTRSTILKGV